MLKAGGIWVSPAEVESRLLDIRGFSRPPWSARADEHGLDKPVACRRRRWASTEAELVAWCREGLAHFKAPRQVIFVEDLPKTATGKLQRFKVRGLFSDSPVEVARPDDQLDPTPEPA